MKEEIDEELMRKYRLSPEEHEKIYLRIEQNIFKHKMPAKEPIAFIIGGQPGSGKSGLISYSERFYQDQNYIVITVDDYKKYHPNSKEIAIKYPALYTTIISQDANDWTARILKKAIEGKYNFIFEITLKNKQILDTLEKMKKNDFRIYLRIMAVPGLESLMSIHERYQKTLEEGKRMRLARIVRHNIAYEVMPDIVEYIEKSNNWYKLEVYVRGKEINKPELIYFNECKQKNTSIKNRYKTAKEAILAERKLDIESLEKIQNRFVILEEKFKKRELTKEEKDQLEELRLLIKNVSIE